MKERKMKKFVKKRLITTLVIFDIALIIVCSLLSVWNIAPNDWIKWAQIVIGVIIFGDLLLLYPLTRKFREDFERKESRELVEKHLSSEKYIEVIPRINKKMKYYDLLEHLTKIAEFYAAINEEYDEIIIILVFNNEQESIFFEAISKESFSRFYKLKKF